MQHVYVVRGPGGWLNIDTGFFGEIQTASFWAWEDAPVSLAADLRERHPDWGIKVQRADFDLSDV